MNSQFRAPRRKVDGVVLLDKPSGISSNAALQRVRRVFQAAKGGHTGTLDPLASGLLPLCLGEATKFSQTLLDADKTYEAELRLGVTTDTGDAEGQVLATLPVEVDRAAFERACAAFVGDIEQVPPMYSALKVDGRPLYDYARAGIELERKARRVTIERIEVLDFRGERARINVACSKGTYIRTLAEDIGRTLGCGAHLSALRRTRIGPYEIADAVGLAALEVAPESAGAWLLPVDHLLQGWGRVELEDAAAERFCHGQALRLAALPAAEQVRVYASGGRFLGAASVAGGSLIPLRLLGSP